MTERIHHPLLARVIDVAMRPLFRFRERVVPKAAGRVLEVGMGTGLNLPLYGPAVDALVGVEPDASMRTRAERQPGASQASFVDARAEALPFEDQSFDCAVMTFVLCTVGDPLAALAEIRRVLRPGGTVLFAEHVVSSSPAMALAQRVANPVWGVCAGGCRLDRDALGLLEAAGFEAEAERRGGPLSFSPVVYGVAKAA